MVTPDGQGLKWPRAFNCSLLRAEAFPANSTVVLPRRTTHYTRLHLYSNTFLLKKLTMLMENVFCTPRKREGNFFSKGYSSLCQCSATRPSLT